MHGLLSVSFGTSHEGTRVKTIDAINERLRAEFLDWPLYTAWSSQFLVSKVKEERGELHDTVEMALARMAADGIDDVIVSTTCLMQGVEMARITQAVNAWVSAGRRFAGMTKPLLWSVDDRRAVARIIRDEFSPVVPDDGALLLMGHGTEVGSVFGANDVYGQVQAELAALGCRWYFVATVEGRPTFDDVWPLVQASGAQRVHLAPLMIVAGDHALNDLAGDGEGSWANMIRARGLQAEPVLKGLGEYEGIRKLVCDHVQQAMILREVSMRG